MKEVKNYLAGEWINGQGKSFSVINPADEEMVASGNMASVEQLNEVVSKAVSAQKEWSKLTFKKRAEWMFKFKTYLERDAEEIANLIMLENGKLREEADACVAKAMELCDFAMMLPGVISGRNQEVSFGIEAKERIEPVGVVASITPFNFPLMVPMWTIPSVLTMGNALILKPSEVTPLTANKIANLLEEVGIPKGLFSVVHGEKEMVEAICDHKEIQVVSFVGSSEVAEKVYQRSTKNNKRCLALGGAKNHIVIHLDQLDIPSTVKEVLSAAYGMSGQRCMAASVLLLVGNNKEEFMEELIKQSKTWKLPPLISKASQQKVIDYLKDTKGNIILDGRDQCSEKGYYVGPTIIEYDNYQEMPSQELFAPSLEVIKVDSLQDAFFCQNQSPYANGAAIFTRDGEAAMLAAREFTSGMIGINVGVPVPRDPFSFGGEKKSKYGFGDITGYGSISLFTKTKKVTTKWNARDRKDWMS